MTPRVSGSTYYPFLQERRARSFFASSMMIMLVVETVLVGALRGSLTVALSGSIGWSIGVGVVLAVRSRLAWMQWGYLSYSARDANAYAVAHHCRDRIGHGPGRPCAGGMRHPQPPPR